MAFVCPFCFRGFSRSLNGSGTIRKMIGKQLCIVLTTWKSCTRSVSVPTVSTTVSLSVCCAARSSEQKLKFVSRIQCPILAPVREGIAERE